MSERFRCTYSYKTVFDIDYELLKNDGISALLFDIDNTLASYADSVPDEKTADLIKKLCGRGFKIFFSLQQQRKKSRNICRKRRCSMHKPCSKTACF